MWKEKEKKPQEKNENEKERTICRILLPLCFRAVNVKNALGVHYSAYYYDYKTVRKLLIFL